MRTRRPVGLVEASVAGLASAAAAGMLAGAIASCVPTESALPPRGVAVSGPPPPPIEEVTPPSAPGSGAVWVAGYWHWNGMHYAWIPGHWESAHPGAAWSAPRYVRTEGSYYYEEGTWRPAPPATANALR